MRQKQPGEVHEDAVGGEGIKTPGERGAKLGASHLFSPMHQGVK